MRIGRQRRFFSSVIFVLPLVIAGRYELYTKKEEDGYPRTEFNLYDVGSPIRRLQFTRGRLLKE
jgi:hypothetical protein